MKLVKALKISLVTGDIVLGVVFTAAILIVYHWQKKKITALEAYIKLWNPSQLKEDMNAWMEIKEEIHSTTVDYYKSELTSARDKEGTANRIINSLLNERIRLLHKLINHEGVAIRDLVPKEALMKPAESQDDVLWTVRFRNGKTMRFRFPIQRTKRNDKQD